MMEADRASETLDYISNLTWLLAREYFIARSRVLGMFPLPLLCINHVVVSLLKAVNRDWKLTGEAGFDSHQLSQLSVTFLFTDVSRAAVRSAQTTARFCQRFIPQHVLSKDHELILARCKHP
jgi:hypothetical protein